jgi:hypothetical protein
MSKETNKHKVEYQILNTCPHFVESVRYWRTGGFLESTTFATLRNRVTFLCSRDPKGRDFQKSFFAPFCRSLFVELLKASALSNTPQRRRTLMADINTLCGLKPGTMQCWLPPISSLLTMHADPDCSFSLCPTLSGGCPTRPSIF